MKKKLDKQDPKTRKRVFATIVYEESAPENWKQILDNYHVEYFISPYHDKDKNEGDGSPKKPHWHVMVMFSSVKSDAQWERIRDSIGGVGNEEIESTRGYARYLCHLDNPEKAQYDVKDVIEGCGADYRDIISKNSDYRKSIKEMIRFVRDNHIIFYTDLMDHAMEFEPDWYDTLCNKGSYVINTYITDQRMQLRWNR